MRMRMKMRTGMRKRSEEAKLVNGGNRQVVSCNNKTSCLAKAPNTEMQNCPRCYQLLGV
jgi:hypothetical protein